MAQGCSPLGVCNDRAQAIVEAADALLHRHLVRTLQVLASSIESSATALERLRGHLVLARDFVEHGEAGFHVIAPRFRDLAVEEILATKACASWREGRVRGNHHRERIPLD